MVRNYVVLVRRGRCHMLGLPSFVYTVCRTCRVGLPFGGLGYDDGCRSARIVGW
jgi:hypothetical protein